MAHGNVATQIEVKIVYPSAHRPVEGDFSLDATIRQVKQLALDAFGLTEGTVDGNQIVVFLVHKHVKIENLDQPLSGFIEPHQHKVQFQLVKEIIAGGLGD